MLSNLINPQVLADMISAELPKKIKLAPFAKIDTTLTAQPGSKITVPRYGYVGDAAVVAEGVAAGTATLSTSKVDYEVAKAVKAIELTDEEILSGYGDPVGEAQRQILMAIANKIDNDVVAQFNAATLINDKSAVAFDNLMIADSLKLFGEIDDAKVLFVHPDKYADLLKLDAFVDASKYGQNVLYTGEIGQILGMRVVVSSKLTKTGNVYDSIIAVPGAVTIFMKRDVNVETDRDVLASVNVLKADEHYTVALTDATRVVKVKSL